MALSAEAQGRDPYAMRFRHRDAEEPEEPHGEDELAAAWHDSDLAEEVVAFLEGRLVDFYTIKGRLLPAWVALNRVAHADRSELVTLVAGAARGPLRAPWATTERFIAARVLAQASTPTLLDQLQSQVLVPVELAMLSRSKSEILDAEQVLAAAVSALDAHAG
jgi:hypothetical protein